jgi:LVIVD repeat
MRARRALFAAIVAVGALAMPAAATAQDVRSDNMTLLKNLPKVDAAAQSDLAFQGRHAYAGTFSGLRVIDIADPANATQVAFEPCNGGQFDVSVWEDLLFASVDTPQTNDGCSASNTTASTPGAWEGVRVFDISDPTDPTLIKSVATDCGSHTHTIVPDPDNDNRVFIYVSSYGLTTSSIGPNCQQFHGKISVIRVPLNRPERARVVAEPAVDVPVFDHTRLELGSTGLMDTSGCHDITVLAPRQLAAAACLSVGQIWDISNIRRPEPLMTLNTPFVRAWHSAQFTWDGERVAFGDEAGGGVLGRCRAQDYPLTGAVWIYEVSSGRELGLYKLPRFFGEDDHCTMHNFNFVPGVDRDILVSAAYHGGTTVADVTRPWDPEEIGFYEAQGPPHALTWSSYWHNGFVYANDIDRGFDVFEIRHRFLQGAESLDRNNPQTQEVEFEVDRNDRPSRKFGTFGTLPAGEQLGLRIGGFARITRGLDGTEVRALVFGLDGRTTYGAHLHNAPCSAADPGGGHYKNDLLGEAMPPNELWLSSTDDPLAGIISNRGGVARGEGSADWIARPEAQSVVIHQIPPGGTPAGGPKIACADLR